MTKQFRGTRKAPLPALTELRVQAQTVPKRAESNPVRRNRCNPSTSVRKPTALAHLEAR